MINASSFKKILSQQLLSHQILLESLQQLNHVIFLQNNDQPIIGILADQYITGSFQDLHFFQQSTFNQYKKNTDFHHLNEFLASSLDSHHRALTIGFIAYDFAVNQHIQAQVKSQPSIFLGQFSTYLSYENQTWYFNSDHQDAEYLFIKVQDYIKNHQASQKLELTTQCKPRWSKQEYSQAFNKIQNYILAGDCYQINLTQEFTTKAYGTLLSTANDFWQLTDAPYSGYLRLNDFEILSCSPELFMDFETKRKIITKPIKGTMPRYSDPILDEQSKNNLIHSQKDQAENLMIVDLLRNDLSVFAEIGSVKTPKLFNIESFNQVHHMVSEIEATLKPEVNPLEILLHSLPGGSITGAPKIRAMEIIEELEVTPRGAYCGSMGYFNFDGTGSWNILIRTIQKYQDDVSIWAGGGITIASDCDAEYQECFDKVSAMLDLLNTWN